MTSARTSLLTLLSLDRRAQRAHPAVGVSFEMVEWSSDPASSAVHGLGT
jgi:hypothetical protein